MTKIETILGFIKRRKLTIITGFAAGSMMLLHFLLGYGNFGGVSPILENLIGDLILIMSAFLMVTVARLYERSKDLTLAVKSAQDFKAELEDRIDSAGVHAIRAMARAIDARDHNTSSHSGGVAAFAGKIAKQMKLDDTSRSILWQAGFVHDVGKIGIPDAVLLKPGRLTDEEFDMIKRHPEVGASLLQPLTGLDEVVTTVLTHHERYDGKGYPHGLAGEDIPLLGRIMAIADSYEAMTSPRVYRRNPLTHPEAAKELVRGSGTQFDPTLVEVMLEVLEIEGLLGEAVADELVRSVEGIVEG